MPVPSGSFSKLRIGGGFTISNARKSIKPASSGFHRRGHAIRVTSWPATSSITTCRGSFSPQRRASRVAAGIPMAVTTTISRTATGMRASAGMCDARSHHSRTVASDPQEPGADRRRPAPKKVATRLAHLGAGFDGLAASLWLCEGLIGVVGIVGLWVAQRRGDDVRTTRPLAEVDQTASVAAERELGIACDQNLPAGGASQADNAL